VSSAARDGFDTALACARLEMSDLSVIRKLQRDVICLMLLHELACSFQVQYSECSGPTKAKSQLLVIDNTHIGNVIVR
jgi:hypothetical protein